MSRAINETLREYYKVEEASPQPVTEIYEGKNDALCIDGNAFDTSAYLEKILKTLDLSDLLAKETEVVEQIKSLDAEMQTLVYENYNRFINATDTIKLMKADFKIVENEMDTLDEKVARISDSASQIKNVMCEKRAEMKNLTETQRSIEELDHLFKMPTYLKELMEKRDYTTFIHEYYRTREFLNSTQVTSSNLTTFKVLKTECEGLVDVLKSHLQQSFNPNVENETIFYHSIVLLKLDSQSKDIISRFIRNATIKVQLANEELANFEAPLDEYFYRYSEEVLAQIKELSYCILKLMSRGCPQDTRRFVEDGDLSLYSTWLVDIIDLGLERIQKMISDHMNKISVDRSSFYEKVYSLFARDLFHALVEDFSKEFKSENITTLDEVTSFYTDLIVGKTAGLVSSLIKVQMDKFQQGFLEKVFLELDTVSKTLTKKEINDLNLHSKCESLVNFLDEALLDLVEKAVLLIRVNKGLCENVQFQLNFYIQLLRRNLFIQSLYSIHDRIQSMANESATLNLLSTYGTSYSLISFLVTTNAFLQLTGESHLLKCLQYIDKIILTQETNSPEEIKRCLLKFQLSKDFITNESFVDGLRQRFQTTLSFVIRAYGNSLSLLLWKSDETLRLDWMPNQDMSSNTMFKTVRAVFKKIYSDLVSLNSIIIKILGGTSQLMSPSQTHKAADMGKGRLPDLSNDSAYLNNQLRKLFSTQFDIYDSQLNFDASSIILSLVKIILKAFCENVRQCHLQTTSVYQIQIDLAFLQRVLRTLKIDQSIVSSLLEDVLTSLVQRKATDSYLNNQKLDLIIERDLQTHS